jgi:HEAT repeat protein
MPPNALWLGFDSRSDEKKLDKKTKMKLAALRALSESENDEKAFNALKEVALDRSQPRIMRVTAVQSLGDFKRFDIMPTLVEMAKSDPDDEVREYAVYSIGDASKDKNKTVETLVTLFNATPKQKEKQLESILYVIADVGNDKAVDFLVKVAATHDNDDLGSDAVYYLGNIGSEKSRSALLQILKSK